MIQLDKEDYQQYYKFAIFEGRLEQTYDSKKRAYAKVFQPWSCLDVTYSKTGAQQIVATARRERGVSRMILPIDGKKVREDYELLSYVESALRRKIKLSIINDIEGNYRLKNNAGRALRFAMAQLLDSKEDIVSWNDLIQFNVDQVDYTMSADEGISAQFHTSTWSHHLEGTWKTYSGKEYQLKGFAMGETNRV